VPVADEARQGPAAKGDHGTTPAAPTTAKPNGAHTHSGEPLEPVTFPVEHAPDDPGPDKDAEAKPSRFRLFG
jgi:HemY protein